MNDDFKFFNERLFYNSETGVFFWKNTELVGQKVRGKQAGTLNSNGYLHISVKKNGKHCLFRLHRLALLLTKGYFPEAQTDHVNGDRTDNRIENLREATFSQNCQNHRKAHSNNKIGVLGVSLHRNKYKAQITINGVKKHIGTFDTITEASNAYIQAKRENHSFCTI